MATEEKYRGRLFSIRRRIDSWRGGFLSLSLLSRKSGWKPARGGVLCYHPCVTRAPQLQEPRQPDRFGPPTPNPLPHCRGMAPDRHTPALLSRSSPLMPGDCGDALPDDSCKQKNSPRPNLHRHNARRGDAKRSKRQKKVSRLRVHACTARLSGGGGILRRY